MVKTTGNGYAYLIISFELVNMKLILRKSCFTLQLRMGFLIVCIASLVVFGLLGAAFPSIVNMIIKRLMERAVTDPSMMELLTPLLLMVDSLHWVMRILGFALFVASCILLASWFQMNKYSGTGPDAGMFSCFAAANPMNINKRKSLKWWMMPWVVLECLFLLAMVFLTLDVILKVSKYSVSVVAFIVPPVGIIIIGLIQAYCILVVVSYYYEQTSSTV